VACARVAIVSSLPAYGVLCDILLNKADHTWYEVQNIMMLMMRRVMGIPVPGET
jgi:hypothetical protein